MDLMIATASQGTHLGGPRVIGSGDLPFTVYTQWPTHSGSNPITGTTGS